MRKDDGFRYHWLWRVHELDRIDKHRRIHVTTGWLDPPWVATRGDPRDYDIVFHHGGNTAARDGDVLLAFSDADVGVQPHLSSSSG